MEFVATWRMQLAIGMLADERANMLDVSLRCGYESEALSARHSNASSASRRQGPH